MKRIKKIIDKVHQCWINNEDYSCYIDVVQSILNKKDELQKEYQNNAYSYLLLSDFKQSTMWRIKANRLDANYISIIVFIETDKNGYIILNRLNY
jgi:hypothetical protein